MDLAVPVAHAGLGNLAHSTTNGGVGIAMTTVLVDRPGNTHRSAGPPLGCAEALLQIIHNGALRGRGYHFFLTTSWSMALSKVSSATSFFRRAFSSWS